MNYKADIIRCRLDMTRFASLAYDPESYDDLPSYLWNEDLDLDSFAREIVSGNDELFGSLEFALSDRLGIDLRRSGCEFHSTLFLLKS